MLSDRRFRLAFAASVLVALVGVGAWIFETTLRDHLFREQAAAAQEQLNHVRAQLEKTLARDLYAVKGMATYLELHPQISRAELDAYARLLLRDASTVRHVAVSRGYVIEYVYPLAGNEAAIGLDYRTLPEQFAGVQRAIAENAIVIVGPINLIQGGQALIARVPVYVADDEGSEVFRGLAAAIIDPERLYREAGLTPAIPGYDIALRGHDSGGAQGPAFFGDDALFAGDALISSVTLPGGIWQMALRPHQGWHNEHAWFALVPRVIALLLMLAIVASAFSRHRNQAVQQRAYEAARDAETRFRLMFDNANDAGFINDARTNKILDVNAAAESYLGFSREQLLVRPVIDFYPPEEVDSLLHQRRRIQTSGSAIFEAHHLRADGEYIPVEISARLVRRAEGDVIISFVRDISEREKANAALRRSQQDLINSIESIGEGFVLWDRDDRAQIFNQRMFDIMPNLKGALEIGVGFEDLVRSAAFKSPNETDAEAAAWINERVQSHREGRTVTEFRTRAGRFVRLSENRTPDGYIVGIYQDITDIRLAEEQIRHRADYDTLTNLPNRENFMIQLKGAIRATQRGRTLGALLFIDLDRFKNINDTMGHAIGDMLLQEAAKRICASVRETDTVARFGGDEFTVILRDIEDAMNAARIAEMIISRLSHGYHFDDHVFYAGASIGITICPNDGVEPETLLRNADMAMYQAKARGRNTYQFFTTSMTTRAEQFVAIEKDLRRSLGGDEFIVHFQPIVAMNDDHVLGAEALLRWNHPERGLVMPGDFIQVAEETHLIAAIGAQVLRMACNSMQTINADRTGAPLSLSVNVSGRQFYSGFDADFVRSVLEESGLAPECLIIEMTESLLIDDDERVSATLGKIRDLGVELAIDDFGTGYSALSYLRRFPVSVLKIDRAFVRDIESDVADAHLVESIVAMARALRIRTVAEGVETIGQARMLREMGCVSAQGYLYGRPVALDVFTAAHRNPLRKARA